MPDPATQPAATANGVPPIEPWLDRAERILFGDIRPDDYLPVTPEVRRLTDREMAYARERLRGADPAPCFEERQLRQNLLLVHCRQQHVAYIEDESGMIVVVTGLDEIGQMLRTVPGDLWDGRISIDYPDDSIWLLSPTFDSMQFDTLA
jgi:hypothetical protein